MDHRALSAGARPAEALARAAGRPGRDDDAGPDDAGQAGLAPDAALTPFVCFGARLTDAGGDASARLARLARLAWSCWPLVTPGGLCRSGGGGA